MAKKFCLCLLAILVFNLTALAANAEMVIFNTKTLKYHNFSCRWVPQCTVNCIKIEKKQAIKMGGVPCKVCGG